MSDVITNKKQTVAAIRAAVDQAAKVKKILARKESNKIRNETEFNLVKEWVTDYRKRNKNG